MVPSVSVWTGLTVTYRQCMNGRACALPDIFISSALLKKKKKRPVATVGLNSTPVVIGGEWLRRPVRWFWTLFTFNRFIKAIIEASKQCLWKSELSKDWGKRIDVWWRRTPEKRLVRNASVWTPLMSIEECSSKGNFMPNNLHYPDVMDAQCSKKVLSCRRVLNRSRSPAISRELATLFSLESQDLMMSVTLWQNVWNALKEAQISKFFQKLAPSVFASRAFAARFFHLHLLQRFCHLLKILLKTLGQVDFTCWASNFVNSLVQLSGD